MTKRPEGWMWKTVLSSSKFAGMTVLTTFSISSFCRSGVEISSACWVEMTNEGAVRLLLVLDGDLGLRVGAEPAELSRATEFGHLLVELVREHEGDRHQLRGFCGTEGGESVSAIATQALDSTRFYAVLGSSPLVA
jgi:hypothetical protein